MYYLIVGLLALGDLLFWAWGDRRLRPLRRSAVWRAVFGAVIGAQLTFLILFVLFPGILRPLGATFWKPVSAWLYMWHLLVLPLSLFFLVFGYVLAGIRYVVKGLLGRAAADSDSARSDHAPGTARIIHTYPPVLSGRRQFLLSSAAFLPQVALGGAMLESANQAGVFRIRRIEVALPQLPRALDGLTIAHVSDTHVGRFVGPKELDHVVAATAALRPELIVFTGDLIDFNLCDLPVSIDAMRRLQKLAPMAMCVGNHDLFDDGRQFRRRVRNAELGLLVDESVSISIRGQRIELLGLDWGTRFSPRSDGIAEHMRRLLSRCDRDGFHILLAHHPHAFDPAIAAGIPLTLSGHTHGGQIMLTKNIGAGRLYRYWSGLYEHGACKLVVSNGVGNWFPLRINAPAEIIHLTLRSA